MERTLGDVWEEQSSNWEVQVRGILIEEKDA